MNDERLEATGLTASDVEQVRVATAAHSDGEARFSAFLELARQGAYPARALCRHPEWLGFITRQATTSRDAETMARELDERCREQTQLSDLYCVLRTFKRRESLRIFLREVRGNTSMRETASEIADLAEACLGAALHHCGRLLGLEEAAAAFCVLGMGKLGGRELNFSSDVDLVYLCSDEALADEAFRARAIDLARALTDAFAATTEDGYVFRVDLRLRPDGTQGPIVQPRRAMADYLLQYARTWERSAWMKARPVAGDRELGEDLLTEIEPFVYRRYLDFGAVEELRAMKEKIEANAELSAVVGSDAGDEPEMEGPTTALGDRLRNKMRGTGARTRRKVSSVSARTPGPDPDQSGVLGWDVKIGAGGIREIEFFVQALQLVHCGTRPQLRVRNTLDALDRLLWAGLVPNDDHAVLTDAYDFYRRLEHRIQMKDDRQLHRTPTRWAEFDRLAERVELDRETLRQRLLRHRAAVGQIFERLFEQAEERHETQPTLQPPSRTGLELVLRASAQRVSPEALHRALKELGFDRPRQVAGQIQVLKEKGWGPFREDAWGADADFARRIVAEAAAAADPDLAFGSMARFAQAVGDRPGYWTMLRDNPHAMRLLLQVFGSSTYLGATLVRDPNLFERLLAVGTVAVEKSRHRLKDDLEQRLTGLEDPEHRLGILRRFHREETLRIGLHDTGGAARPEQSMEQLSLLAEVVIERALLEVYEPLRTRRRRPGSVLPELSDVGFAVAAMGKLGGRELGFGSDLDIVFVYEEDRQWKLEHSFFARLAQRLIRTLSSASEDGKMYEVDTRLRPSGSQGALVVSLHAFREYYQGAAGTWERQALIRARPIAGAASIREAVMNVRDEVAFEAPLPDDAEEQVATMKARIEEQLYRRGSRDVKFGHGGMVDVEFAAQATQLRHGAEAARTDDDEVRAGRMVDPGIRSQSTIQALAALAEHLEEHREALHQMADDYAFLARVQARLRMGDTAGSVVGDDVGALEALGRRTGHQGEHAAESFRSRLDDAMKRNRRTYEALLGGARR